jgi:hypothetical protein
MHGIASPGARRRLENPGRLVAGLGWMIVALAAQCLYLGIASIELVSAIDRHSPLEPLWVFAVMAGFIGVPAAGTAVFLTLRRVRRSVEAV